MNHSSSLRVLAIGIDAAEPTLVRRLIEQGALPALREVLERGRWGQVRSPANIGSGAVWPTFMTGRGPLEHGVYSVLPWDPRAMSLVRLATDDLAPFWKPPAQQGYRVGVLDVPFAPLLGLENGIEISEWGAHDRVRGQTRVFPSNRHEWVVRKGEEHPLSKRRVEVSGPADWRALREVATACESGARLRGALAARLLAEQPLHLLLAVFPEVHHASHYLWHTRPADGPGPGPAESGDAARGLPRLLDVYREVDRQIGRLVSLVDADAMILIFSLHGMQATQGTPAILDPLLRTLGLASSTHWRTQTWSERRRWAVSALRRAAPPSLRQVYRRTAGTVRPPQRQVQLDCDWARTTAFSVPTDQHGWIRLNLKGREAGGIVGRERYDDICAQLERVLRGLVTTNGAGVVRDVLCVARDAGGPPDLLPDLVVHWTEDALGDPVRIAAPKLSARPTGTQFTGQHAPHGFFILRPPSGRSGWPGDAVAAEDLHRVILAGLQVHGSRAPG
jgi:predicted AlkP superfamily phosphohydrolase/phosphomutase